MAELRNRAARLGRNSTWAQQQADTDSEHNGKRSSGTSRGLRTTYV